MLGIQGELGASSEKFKRGQNLKTGFTELLSITHPIMQAPIGGAAGPEIASAVSNAGALGSLTVWPAPAEQAAAAIKATAKLTARPFSVNIRADLNQTEHIARALEFGAPIIHLFWGDPTPHASAIRRGGAKLFCTVANADEARQALDAGADVLIAQGWEAGGHVRGKITTFTLVPIVAELAGTVPVLAAGGVVNGAGIAAALMLGASGAMMGTRFVASNESRAHQQYKDAIISASQSDAMYFENLFDVGWPNAPHRVLRNSTVQAWEAAGRAPTGRRPHEGEPVARFPDGTPLLRYSALHPMVGMSGDLEALPLYAGQGVEQVREILPAATIVERVAQELWARLPDANT